MMISTASKPLLLERVREGLRHVLGQWSILDGPDVEGVAVPTALE